ncbi:hypothetical protein ATY81_23330 [Rhizobium sp. R72]|uniref:hypothetical protein n=1 Tax=unclassified Rhizobium TaxID=2613769 RepID=UPI000B52DF85|nr:MULTISPECIES: hypothetical protein [unclassified Rhizobium]OWW01885.1 hypothetical protein ATY81_23330 [Rhizobium sp. R72]OWW01988.1 hypothetical protein ATY80_23330 [Rhizobium sp. R711]
MSEFEVQQGSDVSAINVALKTLCREYGVERDRKSVLQIATLLVRLSNEGTLGTEDLVRIARDELMAGFAFSSDAQDHSS